MPNDWTTSSSSRIYTVAYTDAKNFEQRNLYFIVVKRPNDGVKFVTAMAVNGTQSDMVQSGTESSFDFICS